MADWLATKSLDRILKQAENRGQHSLKRTLDATSLVALGIGAIVGIGVFVLTGIVSARYAGPAVVLSFLFASLTCSFVGLCYAEFASLVPIAGSAYTYAYATLGELIAWIIGWDLILEYTFGAATVAWGWSGYMNSLLGNFGVTFPPLLAGTWWDDFVYYDGRWELLNRVLPKLEANGVNPVSLVHAHGGFNVTAFLVITLISLILIVGVQESASLNRSVVFVKIFVLLFFVAIGIYYLLGHPITAHSNWHPFIPKNDGFGRFGLSGVARGAAYLVFAFIGFDAVATASQEARNPSKDIPIGLFGSLTISTLLYVLFAFVLVGLVNYKGLDVADPLAVGIESTGLHWGSLLVTVGALGSLSSTGFVLLMSVSRLLYSMSVDGLVPKFLQKVHPRFRTPMNSSITAGIFVACLAGLLPIDFMAEMVSIGTLLAFAIVCAGILVMRRRNPRMPRPFRTPWVPLVPLLGIGGIALMLANLTPITWYRLIIWLALGLVVYLCYGHQHSQIRRERDSGPVAIGTVAVVESSFDPPERQFVLRLLRGLITILVVIVGTAAVLGGLSMFFPVIDQHFRIVALVLSAAAICLGLLSSLFPKLRTMWLVRTEDLSFDEESDSSVRELIDKLQRER